MHVARNSISSARRGGNLAWGASHPAPNVASGPTAVRYARSGHRAATGSQRGLKHPAAPNTSLLHTSVHFRTRLHVSCGFLTDQESRTPFPPLPRSWARGSPVPEHAAAAPSAALPPEFPCFQFWLEYLRVQGPCRRRDPPRPPSQPAFCLKALLLPVRP